MSDVTETIEDSAVESELHTPEVAITESVLPDKEIQFWPDNIPFTREAVERLSDEYEIVSVESSYGLPISDDGDEKDWNAIKPGANRNGRTITERESDIFQSRYIAERNPFVKRALRLYDVYVFGSDFGMELCPIYDDPDAVTEEQRKSDSVIVKKSKRLWKQVMEANRRGWSIAEFGRRIWRDGEQFTVVQHESFPIQLRFIDPENIQDDEGGVGIDFSDGDVAEPVKYYLYDHEKGEVEDEYDVNQIFHSKIECDSTEPRGKSRFFSIIRYARMLGEMVSNEVTHRQAQNSIILIKKVTGGRRAVQGLVDNAMTSTTNYPEADLKREKIRPGSIMTTTKNIEYEFVTPNSNFKDASPLIKLLIMHVSAATGFTFSMISSDSSDGNFASSLVAESPVIQMLMQERKEMEAELAPIFVKVIEAAINGGKFDEVESGTVWEKFEVACSWGKLVSRDRLKDVQADNILVMNKSISPQEAARRDGADPDKMLMEIEEHSERVPNTSSSMNPSMDDKQASSQANADAGGTNDSDDPIEHDDKVGV